MHRANLYHDALTKVRDIAKNGPRNWAEVLEIVDAALDEGRRLDREAEGRAGTGDL